MTAATSRAALLLAHLPGTDVANASAREALEATLAEKLGDATRAWPASWTDLDLFVMHLGGCLPAGEPPAAALGRLHVTDLYLAFCCSRGVEAAVQAFEAAYLSEVVSTLGQLGLPQHVSDEIQQVLRHRFHVGSPTRPAALGSYAGAGSLRSFVHISALREGYRWFEENKRWDWSGDEAMGQLAAPADDPELLHLKAHYAAQFKSALAAGLARLTVRQRNVLRLHYLDGLSTEAIGAMYRVHRATVFRWLVSARQAVQRHTRRILMEQLEVDRSACESILRMLDSRLEISLRTFFELP